MSNFETPEIIGQIPDIQQIYKNVDIQMERLMAAVEQMENDIFIETMGEDKIKRWEQMLEITPGDTDTLEERRFRIQSIVIERLPYSYRIVMRKLKTLVPDALDITINGADISVTLALTSKSKVDALRQLLETLPLDVSYEIILKCHTYKYLSKYAYGQMEKYDYITLREGEV